jgi:hypothetical protein
MREREERRGGPDPAMLLSLSLSLSPVKILLFGQRSPRVYQSPASGRRRGRVRANRGDYLSVRARDLSRYCLSPRPRSYPGGGRAGKGGAGEGSRPTR